MTEVPGRVLTPIDAALNLLLASMQVIPESETVALLSACGRVLAQDCCSAIAVPPHDASAMDGIAVHAADVGQAPVTLEVSQRIAAGKVGIALQRGHAARIFTGAPLPANADTVVIQENCRFADGKVTVLQAAARGENVRCSGEDISAGVLLFQSGHRLRAQDIGVLASTGNTGVSVRRRCRVALLATGNELVQPGTVLLPGQIYNSNFYSLSALLQALGCEVLDFGVIKDNLAATRQALQEAALAADMIISTGGVSEGEEDHVKAAIAELGSLNLWKLSIKPGKPLAYGSIGKTHFFGLPGNPVSAFVTFCLVVRPCLLRLLGCSEVRPLILRVPAGFSQSISGERQEYVRVTLEIDQARAPLLKLVANQSSGVGSSLSAAAGLAIIPPHTAVVCGDSLEFIPFSELVT